MRVLSSCFLLAAIVIAFGAAPASVIARGSGHGHLSGALGSIPAQSSAGAGGPALAANHAANHSRANRGANPLAAFPLGWDYGAIAIIAPAAPTAGYIPAAMRAPTPIAELPRCRETIAGVSIVRGKACRT